MKTYTIVFAVNDQKPVTIAANSMNINQGCIVLMDKNNVAVGVFPINTVQGVYDNAAIPAPPK